MRTKQAILNSVTALIYQIVALISGLIVPRMILQAYGSEVNGIMTSALQFMGIIALLNIGITGAARIEFYKSLANNNLSQTNNIMNAVVHYMNKVAMTLAIYISILSFVFPYITKTNLPPIFICLLVLSIGLNNFFEQFIGQPYRILLQADQKHYFENILTTICCIMYTIVSVYMINKGKSIISVKFISAIISLGTLLGVYTYVKKNYKLHITKEYDKNLLSQRKDAALHSIANIIHQNTDLIILTLFEDIKLVSVYTVYNFIVRQIKNLLNSFTMGLEAGLGNVLANKEYNTLNRTFKIYEWFTNCFIIVVFSCLICLTLPFVSLYTKGVTDVEYIRPIFAILLIISELIFCIRNPYTSLIYAAGHYRETKNISIIEAIINVTFSLILVGTYGLNGIVIATIFANLIRTVSYIYYCYKNILFIDMSIGIKKIFWTLCTILLAISLQILCLKLLSVNVTTWINWIIAGIICSVIALFITILSSFIFFREELVSFLVMLKGVLVRK